VLAQLIAMLDLITEKVQVQEWEEEEAADKIQGSHLVVLC
jgi:hypothetical protein